ncbi:MAG TPA: hypothetical protein VFG42_03005 [Baekduia sp.]|nr:hypothetical protein [Baekduia sp.]
MAAAATANRMPYVQRLARLGLGFLTTLAMALAFSVPAHALTQFDGIADQHLGDVGGPWAHAVANNANTGETLTSLFENTWVASGRVKYARMITHWNAASIGGACLDNAKRFYKYAVDHGITPVISVWSNWSPGCGDPAVTGALPATPGDYSVALSSLIDALAGAAGGTAPTVIEAWNEPNLKTDLTAALAAQFWVKANVLCHGSCTTLAGDFTDRRNSGTSCASSNFTSVKNYEQDYLAYFTTHGIAAPTQWGFHPYNAGLCLTNSTVTDLNSVVSGIPGYGLWYTETGAYTCQDSSGTYRTEAQQSAIAAHLNDLLAPAYHVAHAFYYGMASGATGPINTPVGTCGTHAQGYTQDSTLYSGDPNDGQYHARLAARTIYGPSALAASTGETTGIDTRSATVHGTVTPGGITDASYHFDYGLTNAYGGSTPSVPVGPGLSAKAGSAGLSGLSSDVTYHYRIVATNADGATEAGTDHTFRTKAASRPSVALVGTTGQDVFFTGSSGQLGDLTYANSAWSLTDVGGAIMTGRPSVITESASIQDVFFTGTDGDIHLKRRNAGTWTTTTLGTVAGITATGSPAAIKLNNGAIDVFFRDATGHLFAWYATTGTGPWTLVPLDNTATQGLTAGDPLPLYDPNTGELDLYYAATDGHLWSLWSANGSTPFTQTTIGGNNLTGTPTGVVHTNRSENVWFRTTTGQLWEAYRTPSLTWSINQFTTAPTTAGDPTSTAKPNGDQDIFYRGTDNLIKHLAYNATTGTWTPTSMTGAQAQGDPTAILQSDNSIDIYFTTPNATIQSWQQNSPTGYTLANITPMISAAV